MGWAGGWGGGWGGRGAHTPAVAASSAAHLEQQFRTVTSAALVELDRFRNSPMSQVVSQTPVAWLASTRKLSDLQVQGVPLIARLLLYK